MCTILFLLLTGTILLRQVPEAGGAAPPRADDDVQCSTRPSDGCEKRCRGSSLLLLLLLTATRETHQLFEERTSRSASLPSTGSSPAVQLKKQKDQAVKDAERLRVELSKVTRCDVSDAPQSCHVLCRQNDKLASELEQLEGQVRIGEEEGSRVSS